MGEEFYILLALLIVGHVIITPLVLVGIARSHGRRLRSLEEKIREPGKQQAISPLQRQEPMPKPVVPEPVLREPERPTTPDQPEPQQPAPVPVFPEPLMVDRVGQLRDFLRGIGMWPPESVAGGCRLATSQAAMAAPASSGSATARVRRREGGRVIVGSARGAWVRARISLVSCC